MYKNNVPLIKFEDYEVDGDVIPAKIMARIKKEEITSVPVIFRIGAINHRIGSIRQARIGREEIFGDLVLELSGAMEIEAVKEKGEIVKARPVRFVYKKEKTG